MSKSVQNEKEFSLERSVDITNQLKSCNKEIQNYVVEIEKINLKLHRQIAKYQAENLSLKNKIKVLEEEQYKPKVELKMNFGGSQPSEK